MQTFILMTKLSQEVSKKIKERPKLGREWLEQVKEKCPEVKFIAHYALLGSYDFLNIYEAQKQQIAAKVYMIGQQNVAYKAESLTEIPYKRFDEIKEERQKYYLIKEG